VINGKISVKGIEAEFNRTPEVSLQLPRLSLSRTSLTDILALYFQPIRRMDCRPLFGSVCREAETGAFLGVRKHMHFTNQINISKICILCMATENLLGLKAHLRRTEKARHCRRTHHHPRHPQAVRLPAASRENQEQAQPSLVKVRQRPHIAWYEREAA